MLQIGFSSKYFTLWNVTKIEDKVYYEYIQNLSIDIDNAVEKAKSFGCTDLNVNNDLRGRNGSFEIELRTENELPNSLHPFFTFGKYFDLPINECNDIDYLVWYYNQTTNRYAKAILLLNGYVEFEDSLITTEHFNRITGYNLLIDKLKNLSEITIECNRNLSCSYEGEFAWLKYEFEGFNVDFRFSNYKIMSYNGFVYGLPIINGKAKKIKNKSLSLQVEYNEEGNYLDVKDIQIY